MCGKSSDVPTSVSPMWGFLMRFCRQLLSVLVNSRLVDFLNMSSISVELDTQTKFTVNKSRYSKVAQQRDRKSGKIRTVEVF